MWFRAPRSARGEGPRGSAGVEAKEDSVIRTTLHTALCLLIASVQLTAAVGAPGAQQASTGEEYYCCCIGECHCTADCCNHAPAERGDDASSKVRMGAGGPVLEAPRSCGQAPGTLQRSPQENKFLAVDHRGGSRFDIEEDFASAKHPVISTSDDKHIRPSSPRAPPVRRPRA
jgi:hypothetical protein